MGTNYYVVKKVNREKIMLRLTNVINTLNDYQLIQCLRNVDFCDEETIVHIGKSSYGWKFCFNHNDEKYYKKNRKSIDEFIKSGTLYNEYYEEVDPNEFWKLVDSKQEDRVDEYSFDENGLRFSDSTEFC